MSSSPLLGVSNTLAGGKAELRNEPAACAIPKSAQASLSFPSSTGLEGSPQAMFQKTMDSSFVGTEVRTRGSMMAYVSSRGFRSISRFPTKRETDVQVTELDEEKGEEKKKSRLEGWWLWESVGVLGSLLALAAIIALVAALDNGPLPRWSQAHTLCAPDKVTKYLPGGYKYCGSVTVSVNSIIAWLSTGAKIAVMIPIASSLGQLKWIYFSEQERSLSDLQKFDSAARRFTGSLALAWTLRGRHFAMIGALAVILSLAFDPFIQNLVAYSVQYAPSTTAASAYIANATTYSPDTNSVHSDATVAVNVKANIFAGLYNTDDSWSKATYSCPSGNCTYSDFASLGVCAQCTDLTPRLVRHCGLISNATNDTICQVSLPNNFTLNSVGGPLRTDGMEGNVMHMSSPDVPLVERNLELQVNVQRPLAIIDSIAAFNTFNVTLQTEVVATECLLTFCVRTYNTSVGGSASSSGTTGAQYSEKVLHTWTDYHVDADTAGTYVPVPATPELGIPQDMNFTVPYQVENGISFYLERLLAGSVGTMGTGDYEYRQDGKIDASASGSTGDMMQAIYNADYSSCATPSNGNICAMQNLAAAMTTAIRNSQWGTSARMAEGETFEPLTYMHVTWYWISLPLVIWLLAVVMLIGTAMKTRKAGLWAWRLNPLALIFLGFDREVQESVHAHGMSEKGLEQKAQALKVKLKVDGHQAVMAKYE